MFDLAIRQQRPYPFARRSKPFPVDEYVIANEKRIFHRARGNLERLKNECDNEQARYQH